MQGAPTKVALCADTYLCSLSSSVVLSIVHAITIMPLNDAYSLATTSSPIYYNMIYSTKAYLPYSSFFQVNFSGKRLLIRSTRINKAELTKINFVVSPQTPRMAFRVAVGTFKCRIRTPISPAYFINFSYSPLLGKSLGGKVVCRGHTVTHYLPQIYLVTRWQRNTQYSHLVSSSNKDTWLLPSGIRSPINLYPGFLAKERTVVGNNTVDAVLPDTMQSCHPISSQGIYIEDIFNRNSALCFKRLYKSSVLNLKIKNIQRLQICLKVDRHPFTMSILTSQSFYV